MDTYTGTEEEFLEFVQDKGAGTMHDFFLKLDELPFYNRLSAALWNDGKDIDKMIAKRQFNEILSYILTDKGLNWEYPQRIGRFSYLPGFCQNGFRRTYR